MRLLTSGLASSSPWKRPPRYLASTQTWPAGAKAPACSTATCSLDSFPDSEKIDSFLVGLAV
eukprot:612412-Lingulodinium_polyedra.AAC.1